MEAALPEGPRGRMLALALTLTLLAVLWVGCVQPLLDWHAARAEALTQRQALLRRVSALVADLPELQRDSSSSRAPAASLLEGGSDAIAGAVLQGVVQRMATEAGVQPNSMETLAADQRGAYRRIGLRVAMAAPWPVLVDLLRGIEQGPPHMLIDDVSLRAPPVELRTASSPVSAAFTVLAFRPAASAQP